jgi:gamma-glutamyltranspeptidase/glutathione hydrolase
MNAWRIALATAWLAAAASAAMAQERTQGRSMVISQFGIVAAEHPIAARAGTAMLESGGNAIDAAVAANAAMGVVAPMMNGIGGDLFAIVYDAKSKKVYGLDASGWAPKALTPEFLITRNVGHMPYSGIHSATVPGVVAGWDAMLGRFGSKSFADVLAPAIAYAKIGFPVSEIFADDWEASGDYLLSNAEAAKVFLPNRRVPEGAIAKEILDTSAKLGGTMTADDLAEFAAEWVEPISTEYRGWTVYEMPPTEQGIAALMMLNIMSASPIKQWGHNSVQALHMEIEAKKLAYADMIRYVGDPRFAKVPVAGMISAEYGRERGKLIDPAKANCQVGPGTPPYKGSDTTYLSTVDRDGNIVSLIQSNFGFFGSGVGVEGGGFVLHNRGALFTLELGHPNQLAGRKRPLHTIIPALMANGDVRIAFGIMGGFNQAQAHAQFVSNVVDHGMNIQAAMEAPRFSKGSFSGCDLYIEARVPAAVLAGLGKLGHRLQVVGDFSQAVGAGQAVMRDAAGINYGASDPRKDGQAIAEMPALR